MTIRRDSTNSQFLGVDVSGSASASTSATLLDGVAIVQVNAYTLLNGGIALGEEAPNPPSPFLEFRVTGASVTIELTGSCTRSGSGQDINGHTAYSGANVSFYDPSGGARNATGNAEFGCGNFSSNTAPGTYSATLLPGFTYRVCWQGTVNTNGITNTSGTMSINFSVKFR